MKRLCIGLVLLTGCASWNISAFGVPMQASDKYAEENTHGLSAEETWGVILILGLAIGGAVYAAGS
jgi:hypothetical protein